jgi:hypothetical protein
MQLVLEKKKILFKFPVNFFFVAIISPWGGGSSSFVQI